MLRRPAGGRGAPPRLPWPLLPAGLELIGLGLAVAFAAVALRVAGAGRVDDRAAGLLLGLGVVLAAAGLFARRLRV